MKQKNSRKLKNNNNFDTGLDTHRPHHAFMKFCGFRLDENIAILYKKYNYGTFKKYLII
jgi:hypothetical protein